MLIRNTCSAASVDPRYAPLVGAAIATFMDLFADDLVDIRLIGSVARGEAIAGESDIDFVALVRTPPSPAVLDELGASERRLQREHGLVSSVDLEALPVDELSEVRRFILSSDSFSLYGTDLLTRRRQFIDRERLVRLVTPDPQRLLSEYRRAIERLEPTQQEEILRYARLTGKDLLKCLRRVAILRGATYERNITAIYHQVVRYAPEHRKLAEELYGIYRNPCTDKTALLSILSGAARSLDGGW